MAWTSPRTWAVGETVTAALMNLHLRDNLNAIASPPYCSLRGTTAQTLTTAGTYYALTFDTEVEDVSGMHVAGNTAAIVVPIAGVYMVNAGWTGSIVANNYVRMGLAVGGSLVPDTYVTIGEGLAGVYTPTISRFIRCSASDSLTVLALSSQAALAVQVTSTLQPYFQVRWVGP